MLKRELNRWDMILLLINAIIGAGIFGLPSKIFAIAGWYSVPAILVCGLILSFIILNFAEVASQFKKTGGPYLYTLEAFGKIPGYIVGWLALVSRIAGYAALINLLIDYLSYLDPIFQDYTIHSISIVLITAFLFYVNYKGVRDSKKVNNILAIAKLIPLCLFILVGFYYLDPGLIELDSVPPSFNDFTTTLFILVFAFTGFEAAIINTGEMKNPQKDIPFALITSTIFVTIFYSLIQIVSVGTYPDLATSNKPIADAAHYMVGSAGGLIITLGVILSIGGTLNANLLAGSRIPFAFGETKQYPDIFAKINASTGIPVFSLIIYTAATLVVSLTGTFIYALAINVISKIIVFAILSLALIKFRRTSEQPRPGFRLKYGYFSAILGVIICIWLLTAADLNNFIDVILVTACGFIVFLFFNAIRKKRSLE